MGIFSRKNSKPSTKSDALSIETDASRLSRGSIAAKSPLFAKDTNGWNTPTSPATTMEPEVVISKPISPKVDPAGYLRSIHAVRERTRLVFEKAKRNELLHFNVDMDKFAETATYVVSIIKVCAMSPLTVLLSTAYILYVL